MNPVAPDFSAVAGTPLSDVVGALLTFALLTAVAVLVGSATAWAVAASTGSWQTVAKARTGVLVALTGAALTGAALAWGGWLLDLGSRL
ncbi:DUF6112 family protein [Myceligenerans xiligouense]|uniref:Uncharacterized protein n=1 Tax=Myceligenerans xiligouense TaxID=253184 RepID=A0A3N4ZNK8_9MICO|nr:DUF6112 family protein [Myceligenerans xiligouense]RPF21451.1 hypothetical protein EDD34_2079 [Myceligenerans xiligouense]